jgi:hypothetical protein
MNVTYVSALYNIYGSTSVSERLLRDVNILLRQPLRLIIYVDDFYMKQLKDMDVSSTVTLVHLPLYQLHIYNMIIANKDLLRLPNNRNNDKDTHEYLALMNTKIEFLHRAKKELVKTEYIAWIDAGCSKMFSDKESSFSRLCNSKLHNVRTVLIPGCYIRNIPFINLCQSVQWLFLGTFFLSHIDYVDEFYGLCLQTLIKFVISGHLTWEVNVWAQLMYDHPQSIRWYYADHNDQFTIYPQEFTE